jgi:hypothetical protein
LSHLGVGVNRSNSCLPYNKMSIWKRLIPLKQGWRFHYSAIKK